MIIDLGRKHYHDAYGIQRRLVGLRAEHKIGDTVFYEDHAPVFTVGRSRSRDNLLLPERSVREFGVELVDVDRDRDVTFHGFEQRTAYFIADLK